jgi:hypothetical protein
MANTVCFYSGLEDSPIDAAVATCREIEIIYNMRFQDLFVQIYVSVQTTTEVELMCTICTSSGTIQVV